MKKQEFLKNYVNVANIHAQRLEAAFAETQKLLPFTAEILKNMSETNLDFWRELKEEIEKF